MKRYAIEYAKYVVVEVEADNEDQARDLAYEQASTSLDGSWDHAQPIYMGIVDSGNIGEEK